MNEYRLGQRLSNREIEVLVLLSKGEQLNQLPLYLHVSFGVARNYARSARIKLGATTTAHAVRLAIEMGYIKIDEENA
jgi:DNA-binding NarL/FixJ family response regulator